MKTKKQILGAFLFCAAFIAVSGTASAQARPHGVDRNYGQERREVVHQRNEERRAGLAERRAGVHDRNTARQTEKETLRDSRLQNRLERRDAKAARKEERQQRTQAARERRRH